MTEFLITKYYFQKSHEQELGYKIVRSCSILIITNFVLPPALACFSSFLQTRYPLVLEASIGVVGVLVALMTLTIPETLNEPLPQSMADFKELKKKTKLALW